MQAVGAWLFILGAILRLELHIVPSAPNARLRAAFEEQRRLADHATQRASQDELTELARRWRFDEELERQVARADRHGTQATLLLIDVDGLKQINDALGHQAGDRILQHVAAAIRDHTRLTDFAARIGGDEFAVILVDAEDADASAAAARIIAAAAATATGIAPTSVSVGSAPISCLLDPADIMQRADLALYSAKRRGGNCYAATTITMQQPIA